MTERQLFSTIVKKSDFCFGTYISGQLLEYRCTKDQDSKVFSKNGETFLAILTLKALLLLSLKYLQKFSEDT